jgi:hypothetical protein
MRGISIKSILLATLAVLGMDLFAETALMHTYGALPADATDEQLRATVSALYRNPGYLTWALILGTASTVVGGYLAARLAQRVPYFNALVFGLFYSLLGVIVAVVVPVPPPGWIRLLGPVLTVLAALGGAWLFKR